MGKKVNSGDLRVVGFKVTYFPPNFSLNTFLLLKLSLTHSTFTIRNKNHAMHSNQSFGRPTSCEKHRLSYGKPHPQAPRASLQHGGAHIFPMLTGPSSEAPPDPGMADLGRLKRKVIPRDNSLLIAFLAVTTGCPYRKAITN